jgi:hypothetical protein
VHSFSRTEGTDLLFFFSSHTDFLDSISFFLLHKHTVELRSALAAGRAAIRPGKPRIFKSLVGGRREGRDFIARGFLHEEWAIDQIVK